jgi:antibiotic biosynthesis monooxygenase (ABM) superfamily enzyme
LWAFSEAALGGILHVLRIPFTGLFIGGSAVIFISLIAYYSDSRKILIESTIKVILVKFVVSPYSPINAYFAVMLQSFLGYLLFFNGFNKISPIVLGFLSLLFSAFQKIIILTIVFGMTIWDSIDIFFEFILSKLLPESYAIVDISISYIIIGAYIFSHVTGGLLAGWYASNLPLRLTKHCDKKIISLTNNINEYLTTDLDKKRKRKLWRKTSSIIFFIFSIVVILISFLFEEVDKNIASQVITMLLRSVLIIGIWYYFVSPLLLKWVNKILSKKRKKQAEEIESIVQIFPNIKAIIKYSWSTTHNYKFIFRIFVFIDEVFINYLLFDRTKNE